MASASGSIGELTFRMTRQGQVVQQRSNTKTFTTPAAEATKNAFRIAVLQRVNVGNPVLPKLTYQAIRNGQTVLQGWVSAYYRLFRYGTWDYPLTDHITPRLHILETVFADPVMHFVTNLDTPGGTYHAHIVRTFTGEVLGSSTSDADYPLTDPPTNIGYGALLPAFTYILFPFRPGVPNSLGTSDANISGSP